MFLSSPKPWLLFFPQPYQDIHLYPVQTGISTVIAWACVAQEVLSTWIKLSLLPKCALFPLSELLKAESWSDRDTALLNLALLYLVEHTAHPVDQLPKCHSYRLFLPPTSRSHAPRTSVFGNTVETFEVGILFLVLSSFIGFYRTTVRLSVQKSKLARVTTQNFLPPASCFLWLPAASLIHVMFFKGLSTLSPAGSAFIG